jgi:hypothetical protein
MRYFLSLIAALFMLVSLEAQVHVSFHVNLGSQPVWGPTGNDYVEYYYLPDIDAYYSVPQHRFYYFEGGRWIGRANLPPRYHDYDLYSSYKVVVNEQRPWRHNDNYREKYSSYRGRHDQKPIRDSRDPKYFVNKNHPEHNNWMQQQRRGNGNHDLINRGNAGPGNKGMRPDNRGARPDRPMKPGQKAGPAQNVKPGARQGQGQNIGPNKNAKPNNDKRSVINRDKQNNDKDKR